jgi:hypothetical protein
VSDDYTQALEQELARWRELEATARRQRAAVVQRQARDLEDLKEELPPQVRGALEAHARSRELRPQEPEARQAGLEQEARAAQVAAHDAMRLNLELLQDACSYLEMAHGAPDDAAASRYGPLRLAPTVAWPARGKVA